VRRVAALLGAGPCVTVRREQVRLLRCAACFLDGFGEHSTVRSLLLRAATTDKEKNVPLTDAQLSPL
jgi:hypothetical protein